jgi:hypothetical protein
MLTARHNTNEVRFIGYGSLVFPILSTLDSKILFGAYSAPEIFGYI